MAEEGKVGYSIRTVLNEMVLECNINRSTLV